MRIIANLTQHAATDIQVREGVFNLDPSLGIGRILTFASIPSEDEMRKRAEKLAEIAAGTGAKKAMIGGASYFMRPLEEALKARGIRPLYSFSVRRSEERVNPDGTVTKVNVFEHAGWVG